MSKDYYILNNGRISRKDNTIYFCDCEGNKRALPIEQVDSLQIYSEVDLNTKMINYISKYGIILNFYNYYGYYTGSFYENIEIYENKGKFQNYLYVIAGNACKDYFKKKKIYSLEEVPEFGNENTILETENKILVQQALESLTMEEREIIILR